MRCMTKSLYSRVRVVNLCCKTSIYVGGFLVDQIGTNKHSVHSSRFNNRPFCPHRLLLLPLHLLPRLPLLPRNGVDVLRPVQTTNRLIMCALVMARVLMGL